MICDFKFCEYFNNFYYKVRGTYRHGENKEKIKKHLKALNHEMKFYMKNDDTMKSFHVDIDDYNKHTVICIKCYNKRHDNIYSYIRYFDY